MKKDKSACVVSLAGLADFWRHSELWLNQLLEEIKQAVVDWRMEVLEERVVIHKPNFQVLDSNFLKSVIPGPQSRLDNDSANRGVRITTTNLLFVLSWKKRGKPVVLSPVQLLQGRDVYAALHSLGYKTIRRARQVVQVETTLTRGIGDPSANALEISMTIHKVIIGTQSHNEGYLTCPMWQEGHSRKHPE